MTEAEIDRQIITGAPDAIILADRDGRIRLWNAAAVRMFGYTAEEVLSQSLDCIIPERFRERHWQGYRRVMADGVTRYGQDVLAVPAVRKDGTRLSLEFSVVLVRDAVGQISGIAALIRDVTARWQREQALATRLAALEARERASSPR
jgi:PAS domain S-box-containing protein